MNRIQLYALDYHLYLKRRDELEDREILLERQCQLLNPQVWSIVYQGQLMNQLGMTGDEGEIQITEEDIGELDAYMAEQERQYAADRNSEDQFQEALSGTRTMSGAQTPLDWRDIQAGQATPVQWGPWH